jgi:ADP-heptose:LPS heptosyltransferase
VKVLLNDGGLGDIVCMTGAIREYHRYFPSEPIEVGTAGRAMEVFKNNPHTTVNAPGKKIVVLEVERDHSMNIVASFAKQMGVDAVDWTPEIFLTPEEKANSPKLPDLGDGRPFLAIDIWARAATRRWPWERWAEVVEKLKPFWNIIEIGQRLPDYNKHNVDRRPVPGTFASFTGKLSVRQTCAVIAQCKGFLGTDSGGVHLAAAVGVPQVCIYSRSPWHSRAYWNTVPVFSKMHPCYSKCDRACVNPSEGMCMDWILPRTVIEAVGLLKDRYLPRRETDWKAKAQEIQNFGSGVRAPVLPTKNQIKETKSKSNGNNGTNAQISSKIGVPLIVPGRVIDHPPKKVRVVFGKWRRGVRVRDRILSKKSRGPK